MNVNAGVAVVVGQNGEQHVSNVLKFPEPISMPRTQNLSAVKLTIAPEARGMIGTPAAPGVGSSLSPYLYGTTPAAGEDPEVIQTLPQLPFAVQLGLVGRRIKDTQYGQIPPGAG